MQFKFVFLIFFVGLSSFSQAFAKILHLAPNEEHPEHSIQMLKKAAPGIHISVGTERAFMGAALNPKSTSLLLIDMDEDVLRFNRINTFLLTIARDRLNYVHLRLKADLIEWKKNPLWKGVDDDWTWWNEHVRTEHIEDGNVLRDFTVFHTDPQNNPQLEFAHSNYLFEDHLFDKLSTFAKQNKIVVWNSSVEENLTFLLHDHPQIKNWGRVSVIDLSNSWQPMYGGPNLPRQAVKSMGEVFDVSKALVLLTNPKGDWKPVVYLKNRKAFTRQKIEWEYFSFFTNKVTQKQSAINQRIAFLCK